MSKFERYQKSTRAPASMKADPRKIDEFVRLRLLNYDYSVAKHPNKKSVAKEAEKELNVSPSHFVTVIRQIIIN